MSAVRYDIRFSGRVQGVFFRATTEDVARRFTVTGWVRNEPDGRVRCVVEGEREELDRFLAAVQRAKRENITDTAVTTGTATGEFADFHVAH
jgi:acylphosphatase